jgi:hypothetical protein
MGNLNVKSWIACVKNQTKPIRITESMHTLYGLNVNRNASFINLNLLFMIMIKNMKKNIGTKVFTRKSNIRP